MLGEISEPVKEELVKILKTCYDPEIPVNIVDLGLIYDLKVQDGHVYVKMTLTAPGCPIGTYILDQVKRAAMRVKGVKGVDVEVVFDPPWSPDRMSEEAKKTIGLHS